ncbi:MAG: TonB-dependent receptor [Porphyromonas sp.]|nr:TonB-dependent receptor [Porphyromonas sp.]
MKVIIRGFLLTILLTTLLTTLSAACAIEASADSQPTVPLTDRSATLDPDSTYHLGDVEVVGFRRNKVSKIDVEVKNLPVTISNISMTPLKIRGIFDFHEATRFTPAVNTRTTYGAFQQLSIRGFDRSPIEIDGMRDERSTINSFPLPDLTMVERMEVVKGPASILTGHSSVGGSINIVRKSASNLPTLQLMLMGGSWNTYQVSGTVGGSLTDGINTLFNFNRSGGDGWRDRGDRRFSLYNNTNFRLSPGHILDVRVSYVKDFYGTEAGLPATMPGDITDEKSGEIIYKEGERLRGLKLSQRYNSESDFMYNRNFNLLVKYTYYINEALKLCNKTMYSHDEIDYFSTETLSYPTSTDPVYPYSYMRGKTKTYIDLDHIQRTFPLRFEHVAKTFQKQIDLSAKFEIGAVKNHLLTGGSYSRMDRVSFMGYSVAKAPGAPHRPAPDEDVWGPGVNAVISAYTPDNSAPMYQRFSKAAPSKTDVLGLFLQDVIEFSQKFKGFAAIRYNHYALRGYERTDAIDRKDKYQRGEETSHLSYHSFTYRLGLVYEPIRDLSFYGSYANFFLPDRSKRNYNEKQILVDRHGKTIDQNQIDFKRAVFEPTTGYQIELGSTFGCTETLSGSLSAYHIHQSNLVRTIGYVPGEVDGQLIDKAVIAQVGTVLSTGLETELNYRPLDHLFLSAGYGLTHVRFGQVAANEYDLKGVDTGDRLNYIPRHTFYSYGNYTLPKGMLKGLDLNYSITYTDKIYRNYGKNLYYDPYTLVNVGANYTIAGTGMSVGLQVNNLLDKTYVAQSFGNQQVPAMPRNYKLMIRYKIF